MDPSCECLISYKIYEELILILCKFWVHYEWQFLRSEYYQLYHGAKRVFCVTGDQIKWFKTVLLLCKRDSWLGEWKRGWFYVNFMWISIRTSQLKRDTYYHNITLFCLRRSFFSCLCMQVISCVSLTLTLIPAITISDKSESIIYYRSINVDCARACLNSRSSKKARQTVKSFVKPTNTLLSV